MSVAVNGNGQAYDRALARLPEVSGLARVLLDQVGDMSLVLPGGTQVPSIGANVSADGRWGTSIDRFRVLQGRMFRPGRADEVVIDPQLAAGYGLRPGSTLRLRPGASLAAFTHQASELALRYSRTQGIFVTDLADQQVKVEQAIQPQADVLALFGPRG